MESKATNFNSFVESKVDERTGLFSTQIELFNGSANSLLGPNPNIVLQYDPLNSNTEYAYGKGWYIPITMVDFKNRKLILSSGESYKFKSSLFTQEDLLDRKQKTFTLKRNTENNYEITHQGGLKEILVHDSDNNYYLKRQITPGGKYVEYTWGIQIANYRYLTEVKDMFGSVLLKLSYQLGSKIDVVKYPGTEFESSMQLSISNKLLFKSTLNNQPNKFYIYAYDTAKTDFNFLNKITGPFGLFTEITYQYDTSGHQLPNGAGITHFPRVVLASSGKVGEYPLNKTSVNYKYSRTNYFGYGGNSVQWDSDYDHSYRQNPDYTYYTIITDINSGRKLTNTYNRFHLPIKRLEEVVEQDKTMKIENVMDYHDNKNGTNFTQQPPFFQQAKTVQTIYSEVSLKDNKVLSEKTEVISYDKYDDYGNLLQFTNKDGAVTTYEYYPYTGETLNGEVLCPPNGYEIVDKIKSTTIIPSLNSDYKDELGSYSLITYTNINAWSKDLTGNDIQVVSSKKLAEASYSIKGDIKTLITSTTNEYYNFNLNAMKTEQDKLIGGLLWKTIDQFKDIKNLTYYEYMFEANSFTNNIYTTPHFDGVNINTNATVKTVFNSDSILGVNTSEATHAYYNGQEYVSYSLQKIDNKAFITTNESIDAEGKSITATQKYDFTQTDGFAIVFTDNNGNISEDIYNYQGVLSQTYITYVGGERLLVQDNKYDSELRLIGTTKYDYIDNAEIFDAKGNLKVGSQAIQRTTDVLYDFHDQVKEQIDNNNNFSANITLNNYIDNTQITKMGKDSPLAYSKTLFNIMQQPIEESFYSGNNDLLYTVYKKYDTLYRLREIILPAVLFEENTTKLGRKQYLEYDDLGRLYRTTAGLIDNANNFIEDSKIVTETTFWPESPNALLNTLKVDGVLVLEKTYDIHMRESSSQTGNLKYTLEYNSAMSPVEKITQPNNAIIKMTYDPYQHFIQTESIVTGGNQPDYKVQISDFDINYKPHKVESFSGGSLITKKVFEYDQASEVLTKATISYPNKVDRNITYDYSKTKGSTVGMKDAFDKNIKYTFYDDGKIKSQSYNNMTTDFTYNEYDMVSLETINLPDGKSMFKEYAYDDFLRVTSITYQQPDKVTFVENIFDNVLGKLSSKKTSINGTLVLQEDYKYTYTDTLYSVTYSGDQNYFPQDEYSNIITKEVYVHNKLNNLLQVDTLFTTGEINTANYSYSSEHFAQVVRITNTLDRCYPSEINLQYNELGQVIFDGKNHITYNNLGQVSSINDKQVIYDETGQIINIADKYFYYNGSTLLNEDNSANDIGYSSNSSYHISDVNQTESYKLYKRDTKNTNLEEE